MAASKKQKLDVLIVGGGPTGIPQSDFESCLRDRLGELGGEVESYNWFREVGFFECEQNKRRFAPEGVETVLKIGHFFAEIRELDGGKKLLKPKEFVDAIRQLEPGLVREIISEHRRSTGLTSTAMRPSSAVRKTSKQLAKNLLAEATKLARRVHWTPTPPRDEDRLLASLWESGSSSNPAYE